MAERGFFDKGLEKYEKFNKITLAAGIAAGGTGIILGMPWLATLGFSAAAIDGAQLVALKQVEKRRTGKTD